MRSEASGVSIGSGARSPSLTRSLSRRPSRVDTDLLWESEFSDDRTPSRWLGRALLDLALQSLFRVGKASVGNLRRRSRQDEEDSSDDDDSEDFVLKKKVSVLDFDTLAQMWEEVDEILRIPQECEPWPWWLRLERCTGILWLRRRIGFENLRMEREKPKHPMLQNMVTSLRFEGAIGLFILLNAMSIGIDASYVEGDASKPAWTAAAEILFTIFFVVEWTLRVMAFSWVWIVQQPLNFFDTFVVWSGVAVSLFMTPFGVDAGAVRRFNTIRVIRLARLVRTIRIIPMFRELWMLVDGVLSCFNLLLWAGIIVGVVIYMFAVAALETITKSETFKDNAMVQEHFGNVGDAMFTLFQIMTFDAWNIIVREIVEKMPITVIFFLFFMGVAGVVLFNLMTAIVVSNTIYEKPKKDEEAIARIKEVEQRRMQIKLLKLFDEIDADGSGRLSREEFNEVLEDVNFAKAMGLLEVDLDDLPEFFDILDDDGTGDISVDNFVTGLMRMQGLAKAREILKASKRMSVCKSVAQKTVETLSEGACVSLDHAVGDLDVMHEDFIKMQAMIAKHLDSLNAIGIRQIVRSTLPEVPYAREPTMKQAQSRERALDRARRAQERAGGGSPSAARGLPAASSAGFKRLPQDFVVRHRESKLARLKEEEAERKAAAEEKRKRMRELAGQSGAAAVAQAMRERGGEPEEHLSGVHRDFEEIWLQHGLDVPDLSLGGKPMEFALASGPPQPGRAARAPPRLIGPVQLPNSLATPGPLAAKEGWPALPEKPPTPPDEASPLSDLRQLGASVSQPPSPAGPGYVRNAVPELQPPLYGSDGRLQRARRPGRG